jgi:hypothetical protein
MHAIVDIGPAPTASMRMLRSAEELAKGARALAAIDSPVPFLFLCGQVLESALRAIVAKTSFGEDERRMRDALKHDSVKAWDLAVQAGAGLDDPMPIGLQQLSEFHRTFGLRYGYNDRVVLVFDNRTELLATIEGVLDRARACIA